ncbi:MAG: response regulator [Lachnospiraceae bacterium]|nr:response regulator [Lachnospiraceae bacterium]
MKLTTLCYIEQDERYLMLHRVKKENDLNHDKWIGVGGKLEDGETPEECLLREVQEETGYTLTQYRLRGIITFLSDEWESETMYLYTATGFTGTQCTCDEGNLVWVPKKEIESLKLWEGDKIFFRLLEEDKGVFSLKLRYEGDTLVEQKVEQDITGEYRSKVELIQEARSASRAKTRFLAEMSHDIRTPMNAIVGMTDIALAEKEMSERVRHCLEKIHETSDYMMSLFSDVLDISRIESGRIMLCKKPVDIADIIHEILVVAAPQAQARNLNFRFHMGDMEQECVMADGARLKQVFLNLISNAIKYTDEGSVDFFLSVEADRGEHVRLKACVRDTGIGIAPEFIEHIFEVFEREQSAMISKRQGTGLGMAITKKLLDMMHGHIELESEQGKGTAVRLEIPLVAVAQDEDMYRSALCGRRVLFLTGDEKQARAVGSMLERIGMSMDWAATGEDAVDYINECSWNDTEYFALLTVEQVPELEIMLFLPQVRSRMGSDFPMLMLAESDWSQTEYMLTRSGLSGFVPLPLFRSKLYQALYEYTGEGRQQTNRAEVQEPVFDFRGRRLLLVEDNELNREIAVALLESTNAEIVTAENGQEAVELFDRSEPAYYDLILMDIQMPVMNGLEATSTIRGLNRVDAGSIPIIAMTANAFAEDVQNSLDAGMNAHISKPMDRNRVCSCIQQFVGG